MSNIKKTIIVNPDLFRFTGGSQTRKNREKEAKPLPIVSPNQLKTKLLNRIKQHKNNEINELKQKSAEVKNDKYSDEFYDAIGYLSDLSKKHKSHNHLQNKTLKDPYSHSSPSPYVELDLPPELQEPIMQHTYASLQPMKINYKVDNVVPHGCLRGGQKPTYRTWQKTQKYYPPQTHAPIPIQIHQQPVNQSISREDRLSMIKKKLQNLENNQLIPKQSQTISIQTEPIPSIQTEPMIIKLQEKEKEKEKETEQKQRQEQRQDTPSHDIATKQTAPLKGKKYIKTTVRRKYTLGKSNMYRKVGVLIKDKNTRKNVLNAHKELKRTSMHEIKNYLRSHGIMKVGSTAPNDVLRKTYECSRLAGEITNTNKDVLLHNFMQESSAEM